ncbi:MAG: 60S ribosomal export protein NMD3 [Archaeoglobaceae archaeon]|nr:60S ribosomal export protein NMD3 [Archaeoglobaceae archaeon]MDW8117483.1 NMD3-related protein [Archaeoglobaceae archaeon]
MHPAKLQLRGFKREELLIILKRAEEFEKEILQTKDGIDIFFEDVEIARSFISKLKNDFRFETKMSTENLGFRNGRGKYLFVYSIRKS